jgi:hypothetical protein
LTPTLKFFCWPGLLIHKEEVFSEDCFNTLIYTQ